MRDEYKPGVSGVSVRGNDPLTAASLPMERDPDERCGLTEQTQRRIGTHLRAMYDGLVQQPVPDRFRDLIEKLQESEKPKR